MKNLARNAFLALLVFVKMASAASLTPEQKEAAAFIQKMYSYSANMFEAGEFKGGHYDPEKFCKLMDEFFLPKLLNPLVGKHGCDVKAKAFIRYPALSGTDFDIYGAQGTIKKPKIAPPFVEGNKSSIAVTTEFGRTIFFLTKTDKGLRVENALYYEKIPTEVNVCHGQFLIDPTPRQLKYRPACKDY